MPNISKLDKRVKTIHFVGIGGIGMGGIAEFMYSLGYKVTGSDIKENGIVTKLKKLGISINIGHQQKYISTADVVVFSSAISKDNVEILKARQLRKPVIRRAEFLAEIMRFYDGIAVAGTHGKTTTTSLIADILIYAGLNPNFIIGGVFHKTGLNAKLGTGGGYLVAEADESDSSFLWLQPYLSVITNIDKDHMSTYSYDEKKLKQAFLNFITNLPFYGLCIICIDDVGIKDIAELITRPYITYGFSDQADVQAYDFSQIENKLSFKVIDKKRNNTFKIQANLMGKHNVLNILAAIAVALDIEVSVDNIKKALIQYKGVARRMQHYGYIDINGTKFSLYDDYAHHPNEIKSTLEALKISFINRRLVAIFQPHRYSRTQELFDDFVKVLSTIDVLILVDIYPAKEKPIAGITIQNLARDIRVINDKKLVFLSNLQEVTDLVKKIIQTNDIVITLGAGDICSICEKLSKISK